MTLPKPGAGGSLKPAKPSTITASKSTQRIVLPGRGDAPAAGGTSAELVTGNIQLPVGIIMRVLPADALAISMADFEKSPDATKEVSLPLSLILPQIPTGKVELLVQDLIPHMPMNLIKPAGEMTGLLATPVNLPLMDVVMRIPAEQMTVRTDQKPVDPSVLNMADPFSLEVLREQAEQARKNQFTPTAPSELKKGTQPLPASALPPGADTPGITKSGSLPAAGAPVQKSGPLPPPPPPPFVKSGPIPTAEQATPPVPASDVPTLITNQQGLTTPKPAMPIAGTVPLPRVGSAPPPLSPVASVAAASSAAPKSGALPPPAPTAPSRGPTTALPKAEIAAEVKKATGSVPIAPPAAAPASAWMQSDEMRKLLEQAEKSIGETPADSEPASAPQEKSPEPAAPPPVVTDLLKKTSATVSPPPPMTAQTSTARPVAPPQPITPQPPLKEAAKITQTVSGASSGASLDLNTCSAEELQRVGCNPDIAKAIVAYRAQHGTFRKIEDLLKVPGVTATTFTMLTGMEMEEGPTINEVLGFSAGRDVALKDIADRICCWPDVSGCVFADENGLSLVGTLPAPFDVKTVSAFLPKLFTAFNGVYKEMAGREADEIIVPVKGASFHILRRKKMFMVLVGQRRQLSKRLLKVARYVLVALEAKQQTP